MFGSFPRGRKGAVSSLENAATVKVQIENARHDLTGEDLDLYFAIFGELSSPCIIRRGCPDYSYVNFVYPLSAHEVCKCFSHRIGGATVTAVSIQHSRCPTREHVRDTQGPSRRSYRDRRRSNSHESSLHKIQGMKKTPREGSTSTEAMRPGWKSTGSFPDHTRSVLCNERPPHMTLETSKTLKRPCHNSTRA